MSTQLKCIHTQAKIHKLLTVKIITDQLFVYIYIHIYSVYHNFGNTISIENQTCLRAGFVMSFKAIIMLTLFNLHSRRKYYRKELLLMTIYKIAKRTLPKKSSSNSCTAITLSIRYITLMKVGKRLMNLVKLQINHNKT